MARSRIPGVDLSGPFFQSDPAKTFRRNIRDFMDEVVEVGAEDVRVQLRSGQAGRAAISATGGRVADYVVGRTSNLSGKRWAVTGVVSVRPVGLSRRGAISVMAAAARVEAQTHAFRRTTSRLRKAKTDLLKGLT